MAKASSPGRTKTRLSPPLTPVQAAELNTAFLLDVADNLALAGRAADIACYLAFGPPDSVAFFERHFARDVGLLEAWQPNFGDCLSHTLDSLFALGYGSACVLNADSPTLPTALLVHAAQALQRDGERIVLGPCDDGGYYLLGMQRLHARLFHDIAWSTARVCSQTQERAAELALETLLLPPWYDVDDAQAFNRLNGELFERMPYSRDWVSHPARHAAAALTAAVAAGS